MTYCKQYWTDQGFTDCSRAQLLDIPTLFALGSIIVALYQIKTSKSTGSISLPPSGESEPLLGTNSQPKITFNSTDSDNNDTNPSTISITQRHFDLDNAKLADADGKPIGHKLVYRNFSEKTKVALEAFLLIFQVALSITPFVFKELSKEFFGHLTALVLNLVSWLYLLGISSLRVSTASTGLNDKYPDFWYHSFTLYFFNLTAATLLFVSVLLGGVQSYPVSLFYKINFALTSLIFLVSGLQKLGDKPALLYILDGSPNGTEAVSNIFQIISFSWIDSMIFKAHKTLLKANEILTLEVQDHSYPVLAKFHSENKDKKFSTRLFHQFKWDLGAQLIFASISSSLIFVPTVCMKKILEYLETPDLISTKSAWLYAFLMFGSGVLCAAFEGRCLFLGKRISVHMNAILIGEVYTKGMKRTFMRLQDTDNKKEEETSTEEPSKTPEDETPNESAPKEKSQKKKEKNKDLGSIINIMSVDAQKVSDISSSFFSLVQIFVMLAMSIVLLYNLLGWPSIAGLISISTTTLVNYKFSSYMAMYDRQIMEITDKRIQKLNEVLQNIRVIKFLGWENRFAQQIMDIRKRELHLLRISNFVSTLFYIFFDISPTIIAFTAFYFYSVFLGKPLTAPIAFTALSLFKLLESPVSRLGGFVSRLIRANVSLKRIDDFFLEAETSKYDQLTKPGTSTSPKVGFENATFAWDTEEDATFKLHDLNISFKVGKLNLIVGPTASGKSSLLLALLGEMNLIEGNVFLPCFIPREDLFPDPITGLTESAAYCAQTAWLLNATIKDNIVFASPFNKKRYNDVINACGLKRDLEILEGGDETEIGEKGITLSGGQKQRVSLARALYSNSAYVLLDDCLSAVDSHTAVHIYENALTGDLMKNRTCILISHNVPLTVKEADFVVVMKNGRVKAQGSVDDIIAADGFDAEVLKSIADSKTTTTVVSTEGPSNNSDEAEDVENDEGDTAKGKLIEEETKSDGSVSLDVYATYFKYFATKSNVILVLSFSVGCELCNVAKSWWVRVWTSASNQDSAILSATNLVVHKAASLSISSIFVKAQSSTWWFTPLVESPISATIQSVSHSPLYYVVMYSLIGVIFSAMNAVRDFVTLHCGLVASGAMFGDLLTRILGANLRFFDSTPVGRLTNRFSKDIQSLDYQISDQIDFLFSLLFMSVTVILVICVITPSFILFGIFIGLAYYTIGTFYLTLSRDLKRFSSIAKSPVYQHFTETLTGITTIRAYGDERRFLVQNLNFIDASNRPYFYTWVCNRWLAFRTDVVGSSVVSLAAALCLVSVGKIDAGLAGISLSFAASFNDCAIWILRMYAELEMSMNSVERVKEYIETPTLEPPAEVPESEPAPSWPEHGAIEVSNLALRYAPTLPRVIEDVSFKVKAGEKVGVVGRTGAGKSTIISSFFRFVDPDAGSITIDGVEICSIGLRRLRQSLNIIPQDPTLFTGSIRTNLDMFEEYADLQLFEALRRVNLITAEDYQLLIDFNGKLEQDLESAENPNKFLNLNFEITENGD
ncbi:unnamed protein product [Ambrosiozyma monospora]|uniref:Unnamed protein product n=1 Tax=Ambrosiozyma monospora TaxID=43982 RepID=A0ACB5SRR5_AMBMO|nr:unnamed protein product [Ambrosiozyma monospora]